ncbi:hypothetical protein K435DRAFT_673567, partial [Dendrothele bispora CBS 962.96]
LVTPRHAVRTEWNEAATRKHCRLTGEQLFICCAEDRAEGRNGRGLNMLERAAMARRKKTEGRRQYKDLPDQIELVRGMKVMVTTNVETDLDVTNGARGEVVDIILDPEEPPIGEDPIVKLKYLPKYVLVKLTRTRATQLQGLEEAVIPVEPMRVKMVVQVEEKKGEAKYKKTISRMQFPMTAAYGFIDYRAQGQTINPVIVDIATPPSAGLTQTAVYVALLRSSGRENIRLLRDFDEEVLQDGVEPELMEEDDRLERLDEETKSWWKQMN